MATFLKEANFNGTNGTHFKIVEEYTLTQSIQDNQSTIVADLYVQSMDGYSGSGSSCTGYLNGTSVGAFSSISANEKKKIGSRTFTVTHDDDGTGLWSYSASVDTNWTLGDASLSGTLTLPKILRASTISLNKSSMTISNTTATIQYTVSARGTFWHTLTYKVGSGAVATVTGWNPKKMSSGTSVDGTITTADILAKLPTTISGNLTFTLKTYSDSAATQLVGSTTASCNVTVDTTAIKPTISLGSISLDQPSSIGKLVAGYTTAKATCTTTNSAGASSYTVRFTTSKGSLATVTATSSPVTVSTNTLPSSTSNYTFKITATVTDSRGATATVSKTSGTVYGYAKPVISASFYRTATNSSTSADPAGLYVYRAFSATQSYTLGGSNPVTVTAKQDGTTVSSGTWGSLSESDSATLVVTATDSVTSVTKRLTVGTAKFPIDLYDSGSGSVGVGLGATAIANRVRSALSLLFDNNVGVKGYDTSGNEVYVAIYNASNNLWIGARTNGMTHFTGKTYICTGYDSTSGSGNDSAYLAIPNAANDNVTYTKILHETYAPIAGYMTQNSWTSGANDANDAPNGSVWCNCQYVDNLPYTSGYGFLVTIAKNLQFFVRFSSSGASGLHIRYYTNSRWYQWQQVSVASVTQSTDTLTID